MKTLRILLADDHVLFRKGVAAVLALHSDLQVVGEAGNGVGACERARDQVPDVILMDISMPVMDGLKLVSMVRNDPAHKNIPIIIITTEGAQEDKERALALGANAYITKPIQAPQVINTVKELLHL